MIFLRIFCVTLLALLAGTAVLHLLPRLGNLGRRLSAALCEAPGLDLVIAFFVVLPLACGPLIAGWRGLIGAIAGQFFTVIIWGRLHELANLQAARGARRVRTLNSL